MSRSELLRLRVRAVSSRLCGAAIGSGLAAGLSLQLLASLVLAPEPGSVSPTQGVSGAEAALMASAAVAALLGGVTAGALACRTSPRGVALNAYLSWLAVSATLMVQIAATTDVLSA